MKINTNLEIEILDKKSMFLHEEFASCKSNKGTDVEVMMTLPERSIVLKIKEQRYLLSIEELLSNVITKIEEESEK